MATNSYRGEQGSMRDVEQVRCLLCALSCPVLFVSCAVDFEVDRTGQDRTSLFFSDSCQTAGCWCIACVAKYKDHLALVCLLQSVARRVTLPSAAAKGAE